MNLNDTIFMKNIFNLHNGGPENRFSRIVTSSPEGIVRIVLSFKNGSQEGIFTGSNIPSSIDYKTMINFENVSNT